MADRPSELVVAGLRKEYPAPAAPLLVLGGVDFTLAPGSTLVVTGPSGSGKTTLLNLLGALDRPTAGTVILAGVDPARLAPPELAAWRGGQVGFVFQDHRLLPQCTALENVLVAALALGPVGPEARHRAGELLDRVGLEGRHLHLPAELSGGEQQRVALARSLVNSPRLLLADEPTGNLDRGTAGLIGDLLQELVAVHRVMLVLATHDGELARRFDRIVELTGGVLREGDHG